MDKEIVSKPQECYISTPLLKQCIELTTFNVEFEKVVWCAV